MGRPIVAVLKTNPETVIDDYRRLMHLVKYEEHLSKGHNLLIKLNLSWTKYFPSCSSEPWQLEGVLKTLIDDGFKRENLIAVENKTVVTDPIKGAKNNLWSPILKKLGVPFISRHSRNSGFKKWIGAD